MLARPDRPSPHRRKMQGELRSTYLVDFERRVGIKIVVAYLCKVYDRRNLFLRSNSLRTHKDYRDKKEKGKQCFIFCDHLTKSIDKKPLPVKIVFLHYLHLSAFYPVSPPTLCLIERHEEKILRQLTFLPYGRIDDEQSNMLVFAELYIQRRWVACIERSRAVIAPSRSWEMSTLKRTSTAVSWLMRESSAALRYILSTGGISRMRSE